MTTHSLPHMVCGLPSYPWFTWLPTYAVFQQYSITNVMELFTMITQLKNKETHKIITLCFYVIFYALMKGENNL
jgi:hypothetical protein